MAPLMFALIGQAHLEALMAVALLAGLVGVFAALSASHPHFERLREALFCHRVQVDTEAQGALLRSQRARSLIEAGLASTSGEDLAL